MQFCSTGAIEAVSASVLGPYKRRGNEYERGPETTGVWTGLMEEAVSNFSSEMLGFLRNADVQPPLFVFLTLTDITGLILFRQRTGSVWREAVDYTFDREPLLIPEVVVESFSGKPDHILRPTFDMVWQAAGYPECHNYDEHGDWRKPR